MDCPTGLPASALRGMEQQMEASVQQALHACALRPVELGSQRHRILRLRLKRQEMSHPEQS